ncbi:hypothetical protein, partial [Neobacillus novalis]|uniref:hypothetical protein n=1 Tax=Neobacillus novalis TaxID=220687 RepID=UPI000B00C413
EILQQPLPKVQLTGSIVLLYEHKDTLKRFEDPFPKFLEVFCQKHLLNRHTVSPFLKNMKM